MKTKTKIKTIKGESQIKPDVSKITQDVKHEDMKIWFENGKWKWEYKIKNEKQD